MAESKVGEVEWRSMESAPRDGTCILVYFKQHGAISVFWHDPFGNGESKIWCVDDFKHGPYMVRGYCDGDDTHWMPLPPAPEPKP